RAGFDRFTAALKSHGMGQLLDIVPNHMGVLGADNAWWMDVLENGPSSPYSRHFDIDWHPVNRQLEGKVLVPVLGNHYGDVLDAAVALLNSPARRDDLHALHEKQSYRLAYWRVAGDEINYRRFFDINDLAALRMEDPAVFEATHAFPLDLAAAGIVDGLRIDH